MHTINFIANNVDFQKAPKNLIEIIMYQKFLDEKINNVRTRDLRDIKKSLLAELVEFDEASLDSDDEEDDSLLSLESLSLSLLLLLLLVLENEILLSELSGA